MHYCVWSAMITKMYFGIVLIFFFNLYKLQNQESFNKTKWPEARPNLNSFQIDTLCQPKF